LTEAAVSAAVRAQPTYLTPVLALLLGFSLPCICDCSLWKGMCVLPNQHHAWCSLHACLVTELPTAESCCPLSCKLPPAHRFSLHQLSQAAPCTGSPRCCCSCCARSPPWHTPELLLLLLLLCELSSLAQP
jgi:hypothetical protein